VKSGFPDPRCQCRYASQQVTDGKVPSHSLRFIRSGAAALSASDALKLSSFWGVRVITSYSMTEQMPISSKPLALETEDRVDTVGQPVCTSVALVDGASLRPVPWGERGELCISGANVMKGYMNNDAANAKSFFWIGAQRFFRTGDIAR
jgi:long-subunit acyl-CoA synthetase (AMP-forming)